MEGKKMNKYQEIFLDGIKDDMRQVQLSLDSISRDRGDERKLLYGELVARIWELQLAFTRYILEVVADRDK